MAGARLAALAVIGAIAVGVVGCGGGEEEKPAGTSIGLITPGARDDADWTRVTEEAVEATAKKFHLRAKVAEGATETPAKPVLTRLARDAQLVIAPFGEDGEAAIQVARSTEVPTLVWGDPGALRPGLVGDVEVDWEGGAYAAGVIAAHASFSRSVGIVLCDDGGAGFEQPERFAIAAAFLAGARADQPRAKAAFSIAGSDTGGATQGTLEVSRQGMQMIFGICGPAAPGLVTGVEKALRINGESQLVSMVGDKGPLNRENIMLTSVMINPAVAFDQAMRDIRTGRFGKRVYRLDLKNRGIMLQQTGRTPGDAYEAGLKAVPPAELPTASNEIELMELIKGN